MQYNDNKNSGWMMPAEWVTHAATWMVWPHNEALWGSVWGVTLAQVQEDFARVANAIARFEPVKLVVDPSAVASAKALCGPNIELIPLAVNDSWFRDSGPSFVCHPQQGLAGVSWRFNAWGGKSAHDLDESVARRALNHLGLECFGTPLSNEGGAIHVDGEGTLITTESVLLNPNRNPGVSKAEMEEIFSRLLGVKKPSGCRAIRITSLATSRTATSTASAPLPVRVCCWSMRPTITARCMPKWHGKTVARWNWQPMPMAAGSS